MAIITGIQTPSQRVRRLNVYNIPTMFKTTVNGKNGDTKEILVKGSSFGDFHQYMIYIPKGTDGDFDLAVVDWNRTLYDSPRVRLYDLHINSDVSKRFCLMKGFMQAENQKGIKEIIRRYDEWRASQVSENGVFEELSELLDNEENSENTKVTMEELNII